MKKKLRMDFLNPDTISYIIILNEYSLINQELDFYTDFPKFLTKKIIVNNITITIIRIYIKMNLRLTLRNFLRIL